MEWNLYRLYPLIIKTNHIKIKKAADATDHPMVKP